MLLVLTREGGAAENALVERLPNLRGTTSPGGRRVLRLAPWSLATLADIVEALADCPEAVPSRAAPRPRGERNATHETHIYAPGYIAIGDDSGGKAIVIRVPGGFAVFVVDHGSMSPDDFVEVSRDFTEWLRSGLPLPR